eukprot:238238-Chlamydomonas_euryale.AAC.3
MKSCARPVGDRRWPGRASPLLGVEDKTQRQSTSYREVQAQEVANSACCIPYPQLPRAGNVLGMRPHGLKLCNPPPTACPAWCSCMHARVSSEHPTGGTCLLAAHQLR